MLRQLVTLLVFFSVVHLGRLQSADDGNVIWIKNALLRLIPFMQDMRSAINYQQSNLTIVMDAVHQLTENLKEHKNQTAAKFAQLQTSLTATQSFLIAMQSSLDTKLEVVNASLSNHQLQTEDDFDQLQSTIHNNLTHNLKDLTSRVKQLPVHTCGGGVWRRVVYLNMTDPFSTCPSGWQLTGYVKRACGRINLGHNICDSVTFSVTGGEYSKVCGRINGYQWGKTNAFAPFHFEYDNYVDGVTLTHGNPRQHIWTFAASFSENGSDGRTCPCDTSTSWPAPPFVGDDYFCESGVNVGSALFQFYPDDLLWDGENCKASSSCCSGPPYFIKHFTATTTDDIEARICLNQPSNNENIAIELIELYVQ